MNDDKSDEGETAKRRDEVLKRMLNTPPKPHRAGKPTVPPSKKRGKHGKKADKSR